MAWQTNHGIDDWVLRKMTKNVTAISALPDALRRHLTFALLLISAVAVAACSVIQIGYESAPWYASRLLDRYWALDSTQSAYAQERIRELLRWHRRSELPEYVRWLRQLSERLQAPVDLAEATSWRLGINRFWTRAVEQVTPDLTELFIMLHPEQLERMNKRMISENDDYKKEYLPEDLGEREIRRIKRMEERVEYYLGTITGSQREVVQKMGHAMPQNEQVWYDERLARQKDLVATVEHVRRSGPQMSATERREANRVLGDYLLAVWIPADQQRRQSLEDVMRASDEITIAVLKIATPTQKAALSQRLLRWAQDIEAIAR